MPKKLFFITRESYFNPGARNRCYYFSEYMRTNGFQSEVFSFVDKYLPISAGREINLKFYQKLKLIYLAFIDLCKIGTNSIFIINRFNYHSIAAWTAAFCKNIPMVFDMDDWESSEQINNVYGIYPRSKAEYLTRKIAGNSKFCIASSRYLENYLKKYNKKVYYLPTGVDLNKFFKTFPKEKDDFIFSWHGSINRPEIVRYLKFICDCFIALCDKYPHIRLYFAGSGVYSKDFLELLKEYQCEKIVYKGYIDYKNMPSYLDSIDVGLVPLLEASRFNLSKSPVKIFEYMAKAKAVIASNVGEASFIIDHGVNGFLASTREEFISIMERLIKDKQLLIKIGDNAFDKIKKEFSLHALAGRFYSYISDNFKDKC